MKFKPNSIFKCLTGKVEQIELTYSKVVRVKKHKKKKIKKQRLYDKRVPRSYKIYIKSPFWRKRRNEYFRKFGNKCSICGSSRYINLHHKKYGNYGFEKDEDLVSLCQKHHEQFHTEFGKTKGNMSKETDEFIYREKSELIEEERF